MKKKGMFENIRKLFSKPSKTVRGATGQDEPFDRPEKGDEQYEMYKDAFDRMERKKKEDEEFYKEHNRRVRERNK